MQEGFGSGIDEVVAQYRADWSAMQSLITDEERASLQRADKQRALTELPGVFKVDLCLEQTSGLRVELRIFDAEGTELQRCSRDLNLFPEEENHEDKADVAALDEDEAVNGGIVLADPEFKALRRFYTTTGSAPFELPENPHLDAAWFAKLLDPTGYEQTGVVQGSRWLEVAGRLGVDVIGVPSDRFQETIVHELRQTDIYPRGFFARGIFRTQMDGRCLLIRPTQSFEGEAIVDREAFRNLLKDAVNDCGASIPSLSRYLAESHGTDPLWLWDVIFLNQVLRQDAMGGSSYSRLQVLGLRLYGTLSAEQQQLVHRQPLSFKNLSQASLDWLHQDIFGVSEITGPPKQEPTELFPNGLRPNGQIRITDEHNELVVAPVAEALGQTVSVTQALTAEKLGQALAGEFAVGHAGQVDLVTRAVRRFRLGHRHSFIIQIEYAPTYMRTILLSETTYAPKRFVAYEELPAEFKQSVEVARAQRAREIKELQDSVSKREANPPPP